MKRIGLIIAYILVFAANAQQSQETLLAHQFYQNKEYPKAIELYKDIIKANYDQYIYHNLLNSYVQVKDYKQAEKAVKREIKRNQIKNEFYIDLGYLQFLQEKEKEKEGSFKQALKNIPSQEFHFSKLASRFLKYNEPIFAISIYEIGRNQLGKQSIFLEELADLNFNQQKVKIAFEYYLEYLKFYPGQLDKVQGWFNQKCNTAEFKTTLTTLLYKSIQKDPNTYIYSELLIWNLIDSEKFEEAYTQAKSLDKRTNSGGKALIDFSKLMLDLNQYTFAVEALDLAVKTGNTYYSFTASKKLLKARKLEIENILPINKDKVISLVNHYNEFLNANGIKTKTIETAQDKAFMEGFYLNRFSQSIDYLKKLLITPNISRSKKGELKLLLADIQLLSGDIWESQLTYWQIDKDYKESTIGHQAKYKVALLSYYTGDFDWCQNQLNALKGSTSKLISNDAIKLSTFITENVGKDSIVEPVKLYARAQMYIYQKDFNAANKCFDTILNFFPKHILEDDIYFNKAEIETKLGNDSTASIFLNKIITNESEELLIDDALFKLAEIAYLKTNNLEKARELYRQIIQNHPDSIFVIEARKKFRKLRGDNIN